MFYEPYRPRTRRKRRSCLGRIVKGALLFAALWIVVLVVASGQLGDAVRGLLPGSVKLPGGWTHVLLMGVDEASGGHKRTDSMMIASISQGGAVKLTSVMRDMMVDIEGHGKHKINAAFAFGGAELAMKTVNQALLLNITRYALIDFSGFADVIDALGGVAVNVSKAEAQAMNQKKGHKLTHYGDVTLDGIQALRYARLRKLDSDYMRANRQRQVLSALMSKIRTEKNLLTGVGAGIQVYRHIETNMNMIELSLLAGRALMSGGAIQQFRVPVDGTFTSGTQGGVWSIRADLEANQKKLYQFIYD